MGFREMKMPLLEVIRITYQSYTEGYNQAITDVNDILNRVPEMAREEISHLWKDEEE